MERYHRLALVLAAALTCASALAQFTDGQVVEVREGDTWSPATVIKHEGRRYQIRYQNSAEDEWVATDRLRLPGTTGQSPAPAAPSQAAGGNPPATAPAAYKPGQDVESKRGAAWRTAKYQKTENGWILVLYTQGNYREWVEPWRIRPLGSKEDSFGNAPMNKEVKEGEPSPTAPPAGAPGTIAGIAGWREPIRGDQVLYLGGGKAQPARMISPPGEQVEILLDGRNQKVDAKDVVVAGFHYDAKLGQRVQIREHGGWVPGTVMAREAERVRIMIDGWTGEMFHKWRGLEELRPAALNDVPPLDVATPEQLRQLPGFKQADITTARLVNLIISPATKYTPDGAAAGEAPPLQLLPIAGGNAAYAPKSVVVARSGKFAAVLSQAARKDAVIDRFNIATGERLGMAQIQVPTDMVLFDLSPDGTRALLGKPRGERLEVWTLDGQTPRRSLLFFPYADRAGGEKQVRLAMFLAEDRLLTLGGKNELHLWDATTGHAMYTCVANLDSPLAVSASGKYIALSTDKEALVIEAATGKAALDLPAVMARAALAFSTDGKQLLACDRTNVYVVDLVTGKLTHDFAIPGNNTFSSIASPAPGFALVNGTMLIDLKTMAPVWKYKLSATTDACVSAAGQLVFSTNQGGSPGLVSATIPHASAVRELGELPKRDMILEPGAAISLVVNLPGAEAERDAIVTGLTNQLKANGITIADNQPVRLVLSLERGNPITREYGDGPGPGPGFGPGPGPGPRFGPFASRQAVAIVPWISRMRIEHNGKEAWSVMASSSGPGSTLMIKRGQTAQQAAEEQNRPNLSIFTATRLPSHMVMPANPPCRFESDFTGRSFRDTATPPEPEAPGSPPPSHAPQDPMV